jgi:TolA-binding protein
LSYETLIKEYPHNEKVPGALLKQGLSFAEIGDKKTAKVILDKLIEKYPDSREAALAKKKKAELDKKPVKPQKIK